MITSFGKFCRKLRIDSGEILKDMASKLGVTSSYLSAVENGKRKIPEDWAEKISELYDLKQEEIKQLELAIMDSQNTFTINTESFDEEDKSLLLAFAREFGALDDSQKKEMKKLFIKPTKG